MDTRTTDINIKQQQTPRFWLCKNGQEQTLKDILNRVDGFENAILTYDGYNLDDITCVLQPAPFVADKIDIHKEKDWNEFLRLIGIANMNFQKKERNIKDEVLASQGGTIASRYSRFEPRENAIKEINEKFNVNIEVSYYDGIPTTTDDFETEIKDTEREVVKNDTIL